MNGAGAQVSKSLVVGWICASELLTEWLSSNDTIHMDIEAQVVVLNDCDKFDNKVKLGLLNTNCALSGWHQTRDPTAVMYKLRI